MELRQLEYFLMVSELGSFTRAAERLYVSQPAVTNAVRSLEEELDIQLLDRSQRKAALTTEGKIFYRHIKNVMDGISTTLDEINDLKSYHSGHLTIGITPLSALTPCVELLAEFRRMYPKISLGFHEGNVGQINELLLSEKLDFAFSFCPSGQRQSLLDYVEFPPQELMVCCSRQHVLHRANSVALSSLTEEDFILMDTDCFFRQFLVKCFEEADIMPPVTLEVAQVQLLKSLVAKGTGISILPECLLEHDDSLVAVPLSPPLYLQPVLLHPKSRILSHAAQALQNIAVKGADE